MDSERFPFQKLNRDLALKVVEKIPFRTYDPCKPEVSVSRRYPFLNFEFCAAYSSQLCRLMKKRIYYAVDCSISTNNDLEFYDREHKYSTHQVLLGTAKDMNFAFGIYQLSFSGNPFEHYGSVFSFLKNRDATIYSIELRELQWSVEEICGLIEDFDARILSLYCVETSFDDLCAHPLINQLDDLKIVGCEGFTEDSFLKLYLDSILISTTSRTLESSSINKFLKQWIDGSRQITSVTLYYEDGYAADEEVVFDGLHTTKLKKKLYLLRRIDDTTLRISFFRGLVFFTQEC